MKYNMKKLLSLILALLMLVPGAMAETNDYAAFLMENAPAMEDEALTFNLQAEPFVTNEMATANEITKDTVTYMLESVHWFCALYEETESIVKEWCVPVLETESLVVYMAQVSSMVQQMDESPDIWAVADGSMENSAVAKILYASADTQTVLFTSEMRPAVAYKGFTIDAAGQIGYGFCYEDDELALGQAELQANGAHYTVPSGTFEVGSPVYTEDGMLVGVSDGGKNVYSFSGVFEEYRADLEGEDEPAEEPTEKPTEKPTEAPAAEPVEEPADEPADEPEDEPADEPDPTEEPAEEPAEEPEDEDDEPKAAGKTDDDNKKMLIIGGIAVVVVAAFIWKKRKNGGKKNDNTPNPPSRPKYNETPSTPKYEPKQGGDVTAPLNDATTPMDSGVGKTVLVSEPPKQRIVVGIRCVAGTMNGAKYRLEREARIGRDPKRCSIIFPENERGISGLHCAVEPTADGGLKLTDLGSSFGTTANGRKLPVNAPCILRAGDRFDLADGYNRFEVFTEEI